MTHIYDVSIVPCGGYHGAAARQALMSALEPLGGLDWVTPGLKVAIKVNLVTFMKPESAGTTHPSLVVELCRLLVERGALVTVGDSPGGPWNGALVGRVYSATGMRLAERAGAFLNHDFSQREADFPGAKLLKRFTYTSYLDKADVIINFCKLKTHGLTAMSCAVKNMFGVVPGTRKPEYHYLYPLIEDFCDMLVDLCEYTRPYLNIVDAVTGMEGNGPTQGTPRHIGALVASRSPYCADLVCAELIGLDPGSVPTLKAAMRRGLCPDSRASLNVYGHVADFAVPDFKKQPRRDPDLSLGGNRILSGVLSRMFGAYPRLAKEKCVKCGKCIRVCPMDAIHMFDYHIDIDRSNCIRCFCCQEFCPKGAIEVTRPLIARLLGK